jgi:Flavin containing amine oxidoreductase
VFVFELQVWSDTDVLYDCIVALKRICGKTSIPDPIDYHVTRWGHDEFSQMAFTYIPVGVHGFQALREMSKAIYNENSAIPVIMFAGEHTTPYHPSTMHGAYLSGIREAYRLDCAIDPEGNNCIDFSDEQIYERTFRLRSPEANIKKVAHAGQSMQRQKESPLIRSTYAKQVSHNRGRRGASGSMKLRSGVDTSNLCDDILKNDNHSGESTRNEAESVSRNYARRSQRSGRQAFVPANDLQSTVVPSVSLETSKELGATKPEKLKELEDRILVRGIESFGLGLESIEYMRKTLLPVQENVGINNNPTKSVKEVRAHCQFLVRNRIIKSKSWNLWKSFIAPIEDSPAPNVRKRMFGNKSVANNVDMAKKVSKNARKQIDSTEEERDRKVEIRSKSGRILKIPKPFL